MKKQREEITEKIVAAIERGRIPWRSPFARIPHRNVFSKKPYRGMNQLLLSFDFGALPHWGTFMQWNGAGCSVRKGEKASMVVYYKPIDKTNDDEDDQKKTTRLVMRHYSVFHIGQIDDPNGKYSHLLNATIETDFELAGRIIHASEADIHIGGNSAFYHPVENYIRIPAPIQFKSEEERLATLFHTLGYWGERNIIGHERASNDESAKAFSELVAELTACFLCQSCGVPSDINNHASYVGSWLQAMKNDPSYIFEASKMASRIADGILEKAGITIGEEADACLV
jgi:antirestriction protein ArdC